MALAPAGALSTPRAASDAPFLLGLALLGGVYVVLIVAMIFADVYVCLEKPASIWEALRSPVVLSALKLSLISCTITTILSVWVAVPLGYLLSRYDFRGKMVIDLLLDIPIILPPLVIGMCLLILFGLSPLREFHEGVFPVKNAVPAVILAQFAVSAAFAVRTMRVTFDEIAPRQEQVALTLGCSRAQAFWRVLLPQARSGIATAAILAWARAIGEFGPVLMFAGTNPHKTMVLPTAMYLEFTDTHYEAGLAISLLMVVVALLVLIPFRLFGARRLL